MKAKFKSASSIPEFRYSSALKTFGIKLASVTVFLFVCLSQCDLFMKMEGWYEIWLWSFQI